MNEFIRRVYEDGKITIPKEIRELHGIKPGDYVSVSVRVIRKGREPPATELLDEEEVAP